MKRRNHVLQDERSSSLKGLNAFIQFSYRVVSRDQLRTRA